MMTDQQYPKGILPVLPVADVDATTDYYIQTLEFEERFRQRDADGVAQNAQLGFEESSLMVNLNPEHAPLEGGGIYLWIRLFDTKIDVYYEALQSANANIVEEIMNGTFPDVFVTEEDLVAEDDKVVERSSARGTHQRQGTI